MSKSEEPVRRSGWLKRFGVWTGVVMMTAAAATVFALCACKTSGGGRW